MDRSHAHERAGAISTETMVGDSHAGISLGKSREPEVRTKGSERHAVGESMDFDSIGEIIATRRLHFFDESNNERVVSVLVGKPQQSNGTSDYQCSFQVIGIGSQTTQLARGRDSIQALQSALILISASLNYLNNELGGKLIWDGGPKGELGFP